jgi:hypothetical protein
VSLAARPLEVQLEEFRSRRMLAMPLAGTIAWLAILIAVHVLPQRWWMLTVFIGTGMIAYLGMFLSRFTGEHFLDKSRPKNAFDALFFLAVGQAFLVFCIAIPFSTVSPMSTAMSVGIISGLMWVPVSWLIGHWIGVVHGAVRAVGCMALWFISPAHTFIFVPALILVLYGVTIYVLESRWRARQRVTTLEVRT